MRVRVKGAGAGEGAGAGAGWGLLRTRASRQPRGPPARGSPAYGLAMWPRHPRRTRRTRRAARRARSSRLLPQAIASTAGLGAGFGLGSSAYAQTQRSTGARKVATLVAVRSRLRLGGRRADLSPAPISLPCEHRGAQSCQARAGEAQEARSLAGGARRPGPGGTAAAGRASQGAHF